jgi:membrane protease YdiL (CAAX protease family)
VVGVVALLVLAIIEAVIVFAIGPAPPFQPIAVAATPGAGNTLFALNADDDSIWVMGPQGDDAIQKEDSIPIPEGARLLAAGSSGGKTILAVAGSNGDRVELIAYRSSGAYRKAHLPLSPSGSCQGAQGRDVCARSLAIGPLGADDKLSLAVGTLGGQVRVYSPLGSPRLRRTLTINDNGRLVEALAIGDVDGDGHGDLVVRAADPDSSNTVVVPYLSRPGDTLQRQANTLIPEIAQSLAVGGLGVAVAPLSSDQVHFYSWGGASGFKPTATYDAGDAVRSIAAGSPFGRSGDLAAATAGDHVEIARSEVQANSVDERDVADFSSQQPLAARIVLQALLALSLAGVAFAAANPGGGFAAPEALGLRPATHRPVRAAIFAYLAYFASAVVLALLIHPEQKDVTRDLGFGEGAVGDVLAAFLVVVAAPVSEEIFFRGFMFAGLRRRMPFVVAAAFSAAVWGLFHFTGAGSWGVVLQLSIFGVILAWLYERTNSIWPTIAVHMLNNALAFALLTS